MVREDEAPWLNSRFLNFVDSIVRECWIVVKRGVVSGGGWVFGVKRA